jgi:ubiquinone/menaquinone biosynthesis C-methylase UbiE
MNVEEFVASVLPPPPSRVLEVGCGEGELARSLERRGFAITAIDPEGPSGSIFQRVSLEEFVDTRPFEAVVANRSLHHIHDLPGALEKIRRLLRPGGVLILAEFGWEQMDETTAAWYVSRDAHSDGSASTANEFLDDWTAEHEGLHDSATLKQALERSFATSSFEWVPYIAENHLERPELIEEEQTLMQSGAINPIGFRYVGTRK